MADLILSGSTSGSVTLSATAVSGSTTLTLPTTSGTVLTTGSMGVVLQVQTVYLTSTSQLTSGGGLHELTTSLRIAFTPVSASSVLYLQVFGSFMFPNSAHLQYGAFYDVTNSVYVNQPPAAGSRQRVHWINRTRPFDANDADSMCFNISVINTSTTPRTYTVHHGTEGASAEFLVSTLSSGSGVVCPLVFTITEVKT